MSRYVVYVVHDVIISDCGNDGEHVENWEHDPVQNLITEDVQLNIPDRKREMRRKVNLIDVGNTFVLSYCGRRPPKTSSIGENISVHTNCL